MPISMSIDARYVTQSSVYGTGYCGPLTDKKIERYLKQGYYGTGVVLRTSTRKKRRKGVSTTKSLLDLL